MGWICQECETENQDSVYMCEVCDSESPHIENFNWYKLNEQQSIVRIEWEVCNTNEVYLLYSGKKYDVSHQKQAEIDIIDQHLKKFVVTIEAKNSVTTRKFEYDIELPEQLDLHPMPAARVDPDKFDWDAFAVGNVYGEDKSKIKELYDMPLSKIVENEIVDGVVTSISKREVIVNIGYKSEGVIKPSEFRYNPDLKVGDKVEVYVETAEDKYGQLILSHEKARLIRSWDMLNDAYNNGTIVKGYVKGRTKGGMFVDISGIEAFLPGAQIDIKPVRDYNRYVGMTMDFKIVKINQEFKNVIVSHKVLVEDFGTEIEGMYNELEKGLVVEGTVVKIIRDYGVFVDIGGLVGLIHADHLRHCPSILPDIKPKKKLNVVILDYDVTKRRISLGLREILDRIITVPRLDIGYEFRGKVERINGDFILVRSNSGEVGMIDPSERISPSSGCLPPNFIHERDKVEVKVLNVEDDGMPKLGLLTHKPYYWSVGSVHSGIVTEISDKWGKVLLEEGEHAVCRLLNLTKEDGTFPEIGEKLPFQIMALKRMKNEAVVSHRKIYEIMTHPERCLEIK